MDKIMIYYTDSYDEKSSHKLLYKATSIHCDISENDIILNSERGKKPYFTHPAHVHFSISHSENVWACAFAPAEVGLDVQTENHGRNHNRLAERYFHKNEQAAVVYSNNSSLVFTQIWSRKEAIVKLLGIGIDKRFAEFDSTDEIVLVDNKFLNVKNFDLIHGFSSAVAYGNEFIVCVKKI